MSGDSSAAAAPPGDAPDGAAAVWSASRARRTALAAQGLAGPRPPATPRRVRAVMERLGLVQIDAVNVLARAHVMPFHARLDGVDPMDVDALFQRPPWRFTEYWAHEASIVPRDAWASLRVLQRRTWPLATDMGEQEQADLTAHVLELLHRRGPLTAREVQEHGVDPGAPGEHWGWNWSRAKRILEHLFARGAVVSAGRSPAFERSYALPERLWPDATRGTKGADPAPLDAAVSLSATALRALGVATAASVADYHRVPVALAGQALDVLEERGAAVRLRVRDGRGGTYDAWRDPRARTPRRAGAVTLVNPFDPLVFHRPRVEQLFGVRYRIGIYTPAPRRERGYYALLLLQGERITAQVDLKADRRASVPALLVRGAWSEDPDALPEPRDPAPSPDEVAHALIGELHRMAAWLRLPAVRVDGGAPGDLVPDVVAALAADPDARGSAGDGHAAAGRAGR